MPSTAAQINALLEPRSVDELKRDYVECRRRELAGEEFAVDARQAITRELLRRLSREDVASFEGAVALMRVPQNQLNAQVQAARERNVHAKGERQADDVEAIVARTEAIGVDVDGPVSRDDAIKDGWGEDLGDEPPLQVGDDVERELDAHERVRATGLGR